MNLSLTLNFDTIEELSSFLASRTAGAAAKIVEPAPTPTPLKAVEPAPAPVEVDPLATEPVEVVSIEVIPEELKTTLMARLKLLANTMDDPGVLGKFINSFGVSRFSELPDDQLVAFKAALEAEFGNE